MEKRNKQKSSSPLAFLQAIPHLLTRRWRWVTLVVVAGMGVLIWLGFWQLDRLEQRRASNAETERQLGAAPLVVDEGTQLGVLAEMVDRRITLTGEYDLDRQFVLLSQSVSGRVGVRLFTPLVVAGGEEAVLVDRGWIPAEEGEPAGWQQYDISGTVTVTGYVMKSLQPPRVTADSYSNSVSAPTLQWHWPFLDAIQQQYPYPIAPAYVRESPPETIEVGALPVKVDPEFDLSEGSHFSYALQWFAFSLTLAIVYLFLVYRQTPGLGLPN